MNARDDERALWALLVDDGVSPREGGRRLGIPRKRVIYLCEKWAMQRRYSYGVVCDLGWPETTEPIT